MRTELLKFLLVMCFALSCFCARGQVCTGNLGDPVINQDFGSGLNPGPALGTDYTNYTYYSADCPNDGSYTIANRTSQCFGNSWHTITQDHTGNPNGYMMIINASFTPGIFYVQKTQAGMLCPSTKYELAAFVTNLILPSACNGASIQPNLTFTIEALDGTILGSSNTGDIPPTNATTWQKYGTTFTTPANATSVIVKITNNATGGCGNDLALDDITFSPCGATIQTGFASATGSQTKDACIGDNVSITTKAKIIEGNAAGVTYQWQTNINNQGWSDIPGANNDSYSGTISNAQLGTYQYRVGIVNGPDPGVTTCRIYSQPLITTVHELPAANSFSGPQSFCEGTTLSIQATGAAQYIWSGPGLSPTPASAGPLTINNVPLSAAGTYHVIPVSEYGCQGTPMAVQVTINPKIQAAASAGAPVCAGESVQLHASGGLYYKWIPSTGLDHDDIADPVATPLVTTTYSVTISNDACSDNSQSATATIMQVPVADGGGKKVIFEGQSIKLNGKVAGDNITSVYWTPTTGLDDPTSATPMASPTDDITYTLHVISAYCGIATDDVPVRVYKKIIVYNAFSPNNDGINDTWSIEALITYPDCSVMVFDRYGKKVYQSTGYAKPWDGTYGGQVLPSATYYYVIDLKNGTPKLSGWVSIIR